MWSWKRCYNTVQYSLKDSHRHVCTRKRMYWFVEIRANPSISNWYDQLAGEILFYSYFCEKWNNDSSTNVLPRARSNSDHSSRLYCTKASWCNPPLWIWMCDLITVPTAAGPSRVIDTCLNVTAVAFSQWGVSNVKPNGQMEWCNLWSVHLLSGLQWW